MCISFRHRPKDENRCVLFQVPGSSTIEELVWKPAAEGESGNFLILQTGFCRRHCFTCLKVARHPARSAARLHMEIGN